MDALAIIPTLPCSIMGGRHMSSPLQVLITGVFSLPLLIHVYQQPNYIFQMHVAVTAFESEFNCLISTYKKA